MQRSRRALLQRRSVLEKAILERKQLYKVSLSLVLILWGLIFLLNLWMGFGDGHRDGGETLVGESASVDIHSRPNEDSFCYNACAVKDNPQSSDQKGSIYIEDSQISSSNYNDRETYVERDVINAGTQCPINEIEVVPVQPVLSESTVNSLLNSEGQEEVDGSSSGVKMERESQKSGRLSWIASPGLEEFKSRAISSKGQSVTREPGSIVHNRVEPGGAEYNYAAASKGAKVLAYNKEAKGASNILNKDNDKYLRNPCSAEEKFVVFELSEETLVDTVEIANLEHYSSNLKDFELLSSLFYPTESWSHLENFTAENVKHSQRFTLKEPKWARYLKLNLLSHYGSEFYCTLSTVDVYGVDVIERMLEDLISFQDDGFSPEKIEAEEASKGQSAKSAPLKQEPKFSGESDLYQLLKEVESPLSGLGVEQGDSSYASKPNILKPKPEDLIKSVPDPLIEIRPQQSGRTPGDSVLKILMQKVRSLDLNFSVLERYLEELNSRYSSIFKEFDGEISEKDLVLERIRKDLINLIESKEVVAKEVGKIMSWKSLISSQVDDMVRHNRLLRLDVEKVVAAQIDMENKGLAVLIMSFAFCSLAIIKLFVDLLFSVCRMHKSEKFCRTSAWLLLLLSSSITTIILLI